MLCVPSFLKLLLNVIRMLLNVYVITDVVFSDAPIRDFIDVSITN